LVSYPLPWCGLSYQFKGGVPYQLKRCAFTRSGWERCYCIAYCIVRYNVRVIDASFAIWLPMWLSPPTHQERNTLPCSLRPGHLVCSFCFVRKQDPPIYSPGRCNVIYRCRSPRGFGPRRAQRTRAASQAKAIKVHVQPNGKSDEYEYEFFV
jgi:hypothetical protein